MTAHPCCCRWARGTFGRVEVFSDRATKDVSLLNSHSTRHGTLQDKNNISFNQNQNYTVFLTMISKETTENVSDKVVGAQNVFKIVQIFTEH